MLRFTLHQLYVPSLGKYLLPLPKLRPEQLTLLSAHLEGRGFEVRPGGRRGRQLARKGAQRISIDGALGLAASGEDMLDALAPAVPSLLACGNPGGGVTGPSACYFSLKGYGGSAKVQLSPRVESLTTWTCLRRDGLCGLTPDEATVLGRLLARAPRSFRVDCVTSKPKQGSKGLQVGRNVYYRSSVPAADFLSSLRTIDTGAEGTDCCTYLPRDSVIALRGLRVDMNDVAKELGEWCYLS
jgi:hypothetical protein